MSLGQRIGRPAALAAALIISMVFLGVLLSGATAVAQFPEAGDHYYGDGPADRPLDGGPATGEAMPDQFIVKFKPTTGQKARDDIRRAEKLEKVRNLGLIRAEVARVKGRSVEEAVRSLERRPGVEYAEPDRIFYAAGYADEPRFSELWGLDNTGQTIRNSAGTTDVDINAREASEVTRGAPDLVVAVIDSGVNFSHPDLKDRAWKNPGESGEGKETNGVDDDGNGYVDDVNGWDFYNNDNTLHDSSNDRHGTHVAGTIAASVNGDGVVGVAPNVKIMSLKILEGTTTTSEAILAIEYAKAKGAKISNNSWGGYGYSQALKEAIDASGQLFVAAAGNDSYNNDSNPFYPASYDSSNVLSVAAIDNKGSHASFSNYGARTVDVSAPGVDILSTLPGYPEKPAAALSSVGSSGGKALTAGFGAESIDGTSARASFMARAFEAVERGSQPVVLVDDDRSHAGYQDVGPTLSSAIEAAAGSAPEVIKVPDGDGPPLSQLRGKTVVWATGQASSSGSNVFGTMTTLTNTDRQTLTDFLNGGGRLVLAGMDALHRVETSSFVKDTLKLKAVSDVGRLSGSSSYAETFEGSSGTAFAGQSYALSGSTYHDSVAPADAATKTQGLYPGLPPTWGYMNGTSMATPHATGAAALAASSDPRLLGDPVALKDRLMERGKPAPATAGKTVTGKMVDARAVSDVIAPTVSAVAPEDLSYEVAPDANVEATFSEAMDPSTLNADTFTLVEQGSVRPVAATVSYAPASRKATLDPDADLEAGATYTASVKGGSAGGVKDTAGNPLASDKSWSFETLPDTTPPTLQSTKKHFVGNSSLGKTNVPVRISWSATDGEGPIAEYQLQQSTLSDGFTDVVLSLATSTSEILYLVPGRNYQYRVRARDAAGNWSEWAYGETFVVGARQEDSSAIAYGGTWTQQSLGDAYGGGVKHATGAGDVATFTFTGREVAWATTRGPDRGQAEVWIDGQKVANVDLYSPTTQPRRMTFTEGWSSSSSHTLEVRALGMKSSASSGTRVDVDAFVVLDPDVTAPTVSAVAPEDLSYEVAPDANVEATFSEAMDPSTLNADTFTLVEQGSVRPVAATVSYAPASRKATLDPDADLEAGATYTASVKGGSAGGVKDTAGNPLASDKSWSFETLPDTTPPDAPTLDLVSDSDTGASNTDDLTNVDTPAFEGNAEAESKVSIYDGTALLGTTDASVTGGYSFTVAGGLGDGVHRITATATDVAGNVSAASAELGVRIDTETPDTEITVGPEGAVDGDSATFEFSSEPDTTFECRLDAADYERCDSPKVYSELSDGQHAYSVRATDAAGNVDADPAEARWIVDTVAPSAPVITDPPNDVRDNDGAFTVSGTAEPNSSVNLFEDAAYKDTIAADASGSWRAEMTGVAEGSRIYTAKATDAAGNTSAVSNPRTVIVDTTAPTVVTVSPEPAASVVGLRENVLATFSEPMNGASIAASTFKLLRRNADGTTTPVRATVTYDAPTKTATLDPKDDLDRGATYIARVARAVEDLAGNPMAVNKAWRFRTRG